MSGGVRLAGLIAALAMLLMACSQVVQGTAEPVGSGERQEAPSDRDPEKVSSALREIDPCKLLDVEAEPTGEYDDLDNASLLQRGPHSCLLAPEEEYSSGEVVGVKVGQHFDHFRRYRSEPVTIGDATAYETRDYDDTVHDCWLSIPVSFTHAIEFEYSDYDNSDTCAALYEQAETAVEKLRDPDTLSSNEEPPLSQWDGCLLLQTIFGEQAGEYEYEPDGTYDPFGSCRVSSGIPDDPGDLLDDSESLADVSLEVEYTDEMWDGDETVEVAGTEVGISDFSSCTARWEADSEVENEKFDTMVFELRAGSCDTATGIAEEIMTLMEQSPPPQAEPQRPLVYDSDEPDTEAVGACRHFAQESCEPYRDADVPEDADQIAEAAVDDSGVQCALFEDVVEQTFGSEMEALTYGDFCFFVEPSHTLQVEISVAAPFPKTAPAQYGEGEVYSDREVTEIAGWPSVTFYDSSHEKYDVYLSPYDDIDELGHWHVGVEALPERGETRADPDPDQDELEQADEMLAEVVQQHLG